MFPLLCGADFFCAYRIPFHLTAHGVKRGVILNGKTFESRLVKMPLPARLGVTVMAFGEDAKKRIVVILFEEQLLTTVTPIEHVADLLRRPVV